MLAQWNSAVQRGGVWRCKGLRSWTAVTYASEGMRLVRVHVEIASVREV